MTQTNAPSTHPFAPGKPSQKGKGRTFAMVAGLIALVAGLTFHHEAGTPFGWISLVPSLIVLVVAIATHRTLEALAIGALSGLILIEPSDYIGALADVSLSVMMNETIAWLILVCGLMGGFIAMLEKSGCTLGFSHFMSRLVKTRRQSLLCTAVHSSD